MRTALAADRDLIDIWLYTARTWDVGQAERYERDLRDAMDAAATQPDLGSPVTLGGTPYRKRRVGRHILIYRVTTREVLIVRVLHEARDRSRAQR